ncbi:hypothetical protein GBO34_00870 [Roseivirga pacifica]|uniref:hypothetical protein n=1 Tax=Roseivirga pacifica TaxID=1267423 RepID=UPI002095E394|nr:hypothetical protein [Roseivirga pacifica]MCO6367865.1 hypothetical protein [Roseivirga pacifica]MCO6377237.1 hypothetical protein [Roseivirga pacifica]
MKKKLNVLFVALIIGAGFVACTDEFTPPVQEEKTEQLDETGLPDAIRYNSDEKDSTGGPIVTEP